MRQATDNGTIVLALPLIVMYGLAVMALGWLIRHRRGGRR